MAKTKKNAAAVGLEKYNIPRGTVQTSEWESVTL